MTDLPNYIVAILTNFAPLFSFPVFCLFKTIFLGHVLTNKGRRTMADILRTVGLTFIKSFSKYHRVFYGAKWSALSASKTLLQLLLSCCSDKEIRFVIDSTVERRKGPHIKCLGRKRDPVASTKTNKVLCIGQEWLVTSVLVKFPWALVYWACPFLSVLMPPKMPLRSSKNKSDLNRSKRHKKSTCWAKQIIFQLRKWLGENLKCSVIADSAFACYELAHACLKMNIALITRMRIDSRLFEYPIDQKGRGRKRLVGKRIRLADIFKDNSTQWTQAVVDWYGYKTKIIEYAAGQNLWYAYGISPVAIRWVLIRDPKGQVEPIVLMSTDLNHDPIWIIESFIYRWRLETTFEEVRRHLGYETQRHWGDLSVDRVAPCILASFSIICLCGKELSGNAELSPQTAGWYNKQVITFSDILCSVRKSIFEKNLFLGSAKKPNLRKKDIEEIIYWACAA
jgi:DDE superfamily endonuclease